jgi:protein-tyrosine phosphatase
MRFRLITYPSQNLRQIREGQTALTKASQDSCGRRAKEDIEAFKERSVPIPEPIPYPRTATLEDFTSANRIIALKEAEHRPLMRRHFPDWEHRVTYWHVHDLDQAPPHLALAEIEKRVRALIAGLDSSMP